MKLDNDNAVSTLQNKSVKKAVSIGKSKAHQDALLVEYEIAHQHVWKWDSASWQTAAIFFPASLAGFAFIAQSQNSSHSRLVLVYILGLGSITLLLGWIGMIHRWESYKQIIYYRLREIEEELDLWKNRYQQHLRIKNVFKGQGLAVVDENDIARLQRLEREISHTPGIAVNSLMKAIAIGLIVVWIGLLIFEALASFI